MTGHLLGGAGALEAGFTVLALRDQIAPPTINLDQPDPDIHLNLVPHQRQAGRDAARDDEFVRLRRHERLADLHACLTCPRRVTDAVASSAHRLLVEGPAASGRARSRVASGRSCGALTAEHARG